MHVKDGRQVASLETDIRDRLAEIMRRQEAHMAMTNALCDRVEALTNVVNVLVDWANKPSDNSLGEALEQIAWAMGNLATQIELMPKAVVAELRSEHLA